MAITIDIIRRKILDQAMRGRLVEQDPNDESVGVLLQCIEEEKEKLIKEKKLKKQKSLSPIESDEIPYEIPSTWKWVRLGDICKINLGLTHRPDYVEEGIPFLSVKDISKGKIDFSDCKFISKEKFDNLPEGSRPQKGDVLFGRVGTLGKPSIVEFERDFGIFVSLGFLRQYVNSMNKYFKLFMESKLFFDQIYENVTGAAQINLNTGWLSKFLIPLPPLQEQERIFTKVESLFSLCNNWEREAEKQQAYTSVLREKILEDAMKGLLVEQNETDEPAEILLEKIEEKKSQLKKESKIKKQKSLPSISKEEVPYDLPSGWQWVRLGRLGEIVGGGTPKTSNSAFWSENGVSWLTPADLSNYTRKYISKGRRDISVEGLKGSSARLLPKGSVLFSSRAPIGYVAIAENELSTNQGFKSVVPYLIECNEYLYYYLKYVGKQINENATGTTFKEVSGNQLSAELVALPPLNEQKRIVEKIEKVFVYIEELESQMVLPK